MKTEFSQRTKGAIDLMASLYSKKRIYQYSKGAPIESSYTCDNIILEVLDDMPRAQFNSTIASMKKLKQLKAKLAISGTGLEFCIYVYYKDKRIESGLERFTSITSKFELECGQINNGNIILTNDIISNYMYSNAGRLNIKDLNFEYQDIDVLCDLCLAMTETYGGLYVVSSKSKPLIYNKKSDFIVYDQSTLDKMSDRIKSIISSNSVDNDDIGSVVVILASIIVLKIANNLHEPDIQIDLTEDTYKLLQSTISLKVVANINNYERFISIASSPIIKSCKNGIPEYTDDFTTSLHYLVARLQY